MSGITVITPTGDRPLAFGLLRDYWMKNQTVKPDQWIIVDDGNTRYDTSSLPDYADYERVNPTVAPNIVNKNDPIPKQYIRLKQHTIGTNLLHGLKKVKYDNVFIMEDDDWYSPYYLAYMKGLIIDSNLVGLWGTNYYNVSIRGYRTTSFPDRAALSMTGFKSSFIPNIIKVIDGDVSIDNRIWMSYDGKLVAGKQLKIQCSIKGLPGRRGAGVGHVNNKYTPDPELKMLYQWCDDASIYKNLMENKIV